MSCESTTGCLPNPFAYDAKTGTPDVSSVACSATSGVCEPSSATASSDAGTNCDICHIVTDLDDASTDLMDFFDELLALNAPVKAVVQTSGGTMPIILLKVVTLYASNVEIEFRSPVVFGAAGGLRMFGDQPEVIRNAGFKAKLASDADEGDTTLTLSSTGDTMQAGDFEIGDTIVIRGQNDASGKALSKQTLHVLARNTGLNTLTVEALEDDYLTVYPDSDWPADHTTGTTISLAAFAAFTSNYGVGTVTTSVNTVQMATSGITVGAVALISTNEIESDINPNAPYSNSSRLELKKITAISASTVTFDAPLIDTYNTVDFGGVTLYTPITNSVFRGIRATYATTQTSRNTHGIQIGYGYKCRVIDCQVDGSGGQKGNGIRISNSLECLGIDCRVSNPANHTSAEGYGLTVFYSDRCKFLNSTGEGCRHNFLLQKSNHTDIHYCVSINDRISGFDVHGVNSINTHFHGCRGIGGPFKSADAARKSIFRVGNTSHAVGDKNTLITGCFISGAVLSGDITRYAALEVFGASSGITMTGCLIEDCDTGLCAGYDNGADDNIIGLREYGNTWTRITTMRNFQTPPTIDFSNGMTRVEGPSANTLISAAIPFDDTVPTSSEGTELMTTTYTARTPGLIKLMFIAPYVEITGATSDAVATMFVGSTFTGMTATRITVGVNNGEPMTVIGTFYGSGAAQTISVRMGIRTGTGSVISVNPTGNSFGVGGCPFLLIEER